MAMIRNGRVLRQHLVVVAILMLATGAAWAQEETEYEAIDSSACADCHDESDHGTAYGEDLEHSVHAGMECLDAVCRSRSSMSRRVDLRFCGAAGDSSSLLRCRGKARQHCD